MAGLFLSFPRAGALSYTQVKLSFRRKEKS
jgi:hypothetical protein